MSGGRASRQKGSHYERLFAKQLTALGVPTRRVIGSGAHSRFDIRLAGDLQIGTHEGEAGSTHLLTGEVKYRRNGAGFSTLEGWLGDNDVLLLRRAGADPLVALSWDTFVSMLQVYYKEKVNE